MTPAPIDLEHERDRREVEQSKAQLDAVGLDAHEVERLMDVNDFSIGVRRTDEGWTTTCVIDAGVLTTGPGDLLQVLNETARSLTEIVRRHGRATGGR